MIKMSIKSVKVVDNIRHKASVLEVLRPDKRKLAVISTKYLPQARYSLILLDGRNRYSEVSELQDIEQYIK